MQCYWTLEQSNLGGTKIHVTNFIVVFTLCRCSETKPTTPLRFASTLFIEWYFYSVGGVKLIYLSTRIRSISFKFFLKPFFLGSCLSRKWVKIIQTVCPPVSVIF